MKKNTQFSLAGMIAAVAVLSGCSTTSSQRSTAPMAVEPPPPPVLAPTYMPSTPVQTHTIALPPEPVLPVVAPAAVVEPAPAPVAPAAFDNIYVVKNGDALSKIAVAHGVKAKEIMELNNIKDANKILINQRLLLPAHAKASLNPPAADAPKKAAPAATSAKSTKKAPAPLAGASEYVVKPGDALSKIAVAHGVKTQDLMDANNIKDKNKIFIGQKLVIPGASAAPAEPAAEKPKAAKPKTEKPKAEAPKADAVGSAPVMTAVPPPPTAPVAPSVAPDLTAQASMLEYTVQEGDTIDVVAGLFVVSPAELARANGLAADAKLSRGQRIRIPIALDME